MVHFSFPVKVLVAFRQMITLERLKSVLIPLINDDIQKEIATIRQKVY